VKIHRAAASLRNGADAPSMARGVADGTVFGLTGPVSGRRRLPKSVGRGRPSKRREQLQSRRGENGAWAPLSMRLQSTGCRGRSQWLFPASGSAGYASRRHEAALKRSISSGRRWVVAAEVARP